MSSFQSRAICASGQTDEKIDRRIRRSGLRNERYHAFGRADHVVARRHFGFDSRCGWLLYSAFAATFSAFRGLDFTTRLRWLFDLPKPRAIAGRANNLSQDLKPTLHREQSFKQK